MVANKFLRDSTTTLLILLAESEDKWYISKLAKVLDVTYPHLLKIINELEQLGLIKTHKEGRQRFVEVTERGRKLAMLLKNVLDFIKEGAGGKKS